MGTDTAKAWADFVRLRDEDSYHGLYSYYFKYLSYIGLKKGFSSARVNDEINEMFMYLWEHRDQLKNIVNYHSYIITSFLRKLYRKAPVFLDADGIDEHSYGELPAHPSVESQMIELQKQEELGRTLKRFVEQLPEKQRRMIYQKFYLGLSYKEISEANRVSINTVYNTVYKAVEKLKSFFL